MPPGTVAVSSTPANSAHVNSRFADLEAEQNLARPVTKGGTGATSAAAARTALGLSIGTDVQAYDADLAAIAALGYTSGAYLLKKTAAGTFSLIALTAAGEALLDDANAAAQLTTLGIGGDIPAIEALGGTGIAVRTAADTWAQRQIVSADGSVTIANPAGVAGDIDLSAARAEAFSSVISLSGAAPVDVLTGLAETPSYIEVWLNGASLTSNGDIFVQLGDTAYVTSGYDSTGSFNGSGATAAVGFLIRISSAGRAFTGCMVLRRTPGTNIWIATHNGQSDGINSYITGAGKLTLTGSLTRLRIQREVANDFDGGTVYAVYR